MNHILKITGSAELLEPLELGKDYLLSLNVGIDSIKKRADEGEGFEFVYSAKQRTCEILKDNGQTMKTKVKSSMSKKLRSAIWAMQPDYKPQIDEEMFYEMIMGFIIDNLEDIITKTIVK